MEYENYPGQNNAAQGDPTGAASSGAERPLTCPICSGTTFRAEEGRVQGRHGFSSHILQMFVCESCANVQMFYSPDSTSF